MKKRNWTGSLEFDNVKRSLEVKVRLNYDGVQSKQKRQQQQYKKNRQGSTTKTLSGGERSFSTFAMLIALWQSIESPFCALDEFDVYMDSLNRKASVRALLEFAATYSRRQYIIITPQTDIQVESTRFVKIHRLKPPERGQATLPFRPAGAPSVSPVAAAGDDEDGQS